MAIDTTNMCSHLQRKLFDADGEYRMIREQIERDPELTAVVRSRQLHVYRNGKKILVLAGKSAPKIIRDDELSKLLELDGNNASIRIYRPWPTTGVVLGEPYNGEGMLGDDVSHQDSSNRLHPLS